MNATRNDRLGRMGANMVRRLMKAAINAWSST